MTVYDTASGSTNSYSLSSLGDYEEISTSSQLYMHITSTGPVLVAQYCKTGTVPSLNTVKQVLSHRSILEVLEFLCPPCLGSQRGGVRQGRNLGSTRASTKQYNTAPCILCIKPTALVIVRFLSALAVYSFTLLLQILCTVV